MECFFQLFVQLIRAHDPFKRFGLLHKRAHHIGLPPCAHLLFHKAVHGLALCLRHIARGDGLAPGRQFIEHRNIQIAVEDQRQRARDGCCAHDERVGILAFRADRRPLAHTEAVLLIRDHHAGIPEQDAFGKQRVRADDGKRVPRADRFTRRVVLLLFHAAPKQAGFLAEHALHGRKVLLREDLRRRHQHSLKPVLHRGVHHKKRDGCFSAPHIALQEAVHLAAVRHFPGNFLHRPQLCAGGRKGEQLQEAFENALHAEHSALLGKPLTPQHGKHQRKQQHVLKGKAVLRRGKPLQIQRDM